MTGDPYCSSASERYSREIDEFLFIFLRTEKNMITHYRSIPHRPRRPVAPEGLSAAEPGQLRYLAALSVLVLAGMLLAINPSAAAQPPPVDQAVIQTSASGEVADTQETYRSRVRDEMAEWRLKMQAFDNKTEASGKRQASAAETKLRSAWDSTEVEARNLQAASGHDWERAKKSYETAAAALRTAWGKIEL
jgi:hypothetical protein